MDALDNLRVLADWDRDGLFAHALTDLTGRVLSAEWHYGFDAPFQRIAPPAGGTVVLDNSDGAFLPDKPGSLYGSLLRRDVLIQFQHIQGTNLSGYQLTPYGMTVLRIVDIQFAPGAFGGRTVTLALGDWHAELMSTIYDPPLTQNVTTGVAVAQPFAEGLIPLSYAKQYWIMGASELGADTALFGPGNAYSSFYPGSTVLDYAGNNIDRGNGVSLYSYIDEMCAAEMEGRFWLETWPGPASVVTYAPRPRWRFMGRTDLAYRYALASNVTIPASRFLQTGGEYEFSRTICNALEVTLYPRTTGAAGTVLAESGNAFRIRAGEYREMTLRYRSPDYPDGSCTAVTIIQPVAGSDYTANEADDGSGADLTASLGLAIENRTNAAKLVLTNNGTADLYVTLLRVRGTPMVALTPVTVEAVDAVSIRDYGLHRQSLTIAGVDDIELVQAYADYYVARYKDPLARYRRIAFDFPVDTSDPLYRPALYLPLFPAGLRITDDWIEDVSGTRLHWVAGAHHVVDSATRTWQTTWFLEDFVQQGFWTIGDTAIGLDGQMVEMGMSRLGESTRLAF